MIKALESAASKELCLQIIAVLGKIGPDAQAAVSSLIAILRSGDQKCRVEAAKALGHMKTAAKPAVLALVDALKDKDDESLQEVAAAALGEIGPDAREALPALQQAAKNNPDEDNLSWEARRAIRRIQGER